MKRYQFTVDITEAVGTQTFEVTAKSPEEALKMILAGQGEIVHEEVEVQGLAWHSAKLTDEVDAEA